MNAFKYPDRSVSRASGVSWDGQSERFRQTSAVHTSFELTELRFLGQSDVKRTTAAEFLP